MKARRARLASRMAWFASPLALVACGDLPRRAEVVVHVDTDAPIPVGPGELASPEGPPPLFDRVRFEVYPPGEQAPRPDDFAVTRGRLREGLSIGVLPAPGQLGYRVRVQLYRGEFKQLDQPIGRTVVETTIALPAAVDGRTVHVHMVLPTHEVGSPRGVLGSPATPSKGKPGASQVGTWAGARRIPCQRLAVESEVCVPGGAFWMGHPLVPGGAARDDAPKPRLVVVAPFFLDSREVTVGEFRAWLAGKSPRAGDPAPRLSPPSLENPRSYCNLPADALGDASRDELPLNCMSYDLARELCKTRDPSRPDSDLPTEAQLEYAAGALESRLYVWGRDEPDCADAVFARAAPEEGIKQYPGYCRTHSVDPIGGPARPASGARDELVLEGGSIFDLAGNLSELALDAYRDQASDCWSPSLLTNPTCMLGTERVTRGGSWASEPHELRAAYRASSPDSFRHETNPAYQTNLGPLVGFRCARPATHP
jgi:formylglycine-generating enzyme